MSPNPCSPPNKKDVESLLSHSPETASRTLCEVLPITGDASARQYFRLRFTSGPPLMLMQLSSQLGPVGGGPREMTQDDTFVELSTFFLANGIPVPRVVVDQREKGFLVVEDTGPTVLGAILWETPQRKRSSLKDLFSRSLEVIHKLQAITPNESIVCFQRQLSPQQYRAQIGEIALYLLPELGADVHEVQRASGAFDGMIARITTHPKTLVHFDYMPYNIAVRENGEVVVLDFQDACLDSCVRDIVSILNDRSTDEALGPDLQLELLREYPGRQAIQDFNRLYLEYLFLWDCRVSGRFALLSQRGKDHYRQWIPSTLRRLGRTVSHLIERGGYAKIEDFAVVLEALSPEFASGRDDPWKLP